jgi:hypothetical protein
MTVRVRVRKDAELLLALVLLLLFDFVGGGHGVFGCEDGEEENASAGLRRGRGEPARLNVAVLCRCSGGNAEAYHSLLNRH